VQPDVESVMKIKVIVNPNSKYKQDQIKSILWEKLFPNFIDVEETKDGHTATLVTKKSINQGFETIIAVGGDGTVNAVINGMVGSQAVLGLIPGGTANDLANSCQIPVDLEKACEVIKNRFIQTIDLIKVNGWHYITAGGIGLPSQVARMANTVKKKFRLCKLLGSHIYIFILSYILLNRKYPSNYVTFQYKGQILRKHILFWMANNQSFIANNFLVSPEAKNHDGLIDICLIDFPANWFQLVKIILQILKGRHVFSPCVSTWSTRELNVKTEKPPVFLGDGELAPPSSSFKIKVIDPGINFIIPDGTINRKTKETI
jgi:YegS/Rv2252/BmrU family lipid kinase